jgi:hypothetical protein
MNDAVQRNFTYLAYGLITAWAILIVYALTLAARGRSLTRQLDNVKRMLEDQTKK